MNSKKLAKISIICLIVSIILFILDSICFHYVTDSGFTSVKQEEAGKPFVTNLIGTLAVLYLFASSFTFICKLVIYKKNKQ